MLLMDILPFAVAFHYDYLNLAVNLCILSILLSFMFYMFLRFPKPRPCKFRRADHFRPDLVPKNKIDTIVIGSGSGGSACANLLAQSGQAVLVLEQHEVTGGCTHSFRQQGCEWDTGLHYVGNGMCEPTQRAGALMDFMSRGEQLWNPLPPEEPYDEVVFPVTPDSEVKPGAPNESSYSFYAGAHRTIDSVANSIDPRDADRLKDRLQTWMKICTEINEGFVALGLCHSLLPRWLWFLVKEKYDKLMTYASLSVRDVQHAVFGLGYSAEEVLDHCPKSIDNEPDPSIQRLKAVMAHPIGDYAVQPRDATMAAAGVTMAHYNNGAAYTVGPTQNISIRLTSMVRPYGGEVLVDATVRSIIIRKNCAVGVRVSNTSALNACKTDEERAMVPITEVFAKNVVCATSVYNLYSKFLPQDLPVVQRFHDPSLRTIRQSNGHVFLFCKIKGNAEDLKLPNHNLWYFNSYDLDKSFDEYFANPTEVRPPTVYIGFPCTKDLTWKKRFPGVSNCILISDGLYEWFEKWADTQVHNRGEDYLAFKEKLTKHLLDILHDCVPQVKGKLEFVHLGTPLTEVSYLGSFRGGSYGTKCNTEMFDPINRNWTTTPHTEIPGLYVAGSDAFLPAVTGAMYGGCFGACAVLGHLGAMRLICTLMTRLAKQAREENPKLSWFEAYRMAARAWFVDP